MIVDLHTHYPMHVLAGDARFQGRPRSDPGPTLLERIRRWVLRSANRIANYPADGRRPSVTSETLAASNIRAD